MCIDDSGVDHSTYRKPDSNVRVSGVASATSILLITKGLDDNWVVKRACEFLSAIGRTT